MQTGTIPLTVSYSCSCGVLTAAAPPPPYTPLHGPSCALATANEKELYRRIAEAESRLAQCCPQCGEQPPPYAFDAIGRWRWNGLKWEHKCGDPNAGHFSTEPVREVVARLLKART